LDKTLQKRPKEKKQKICDGTSNKVGSPGPTNRNEKGSQRQLSSQLQPIVYKIAILESSVEILKKTVHANNIIVHGIAAIPSENYDSLLKMIEEVLQKEGLQGVPLLIIYIP
jgi:hypothetical protein